VVPKSYVARALALFDLIADGVQPIQNLRLLIDEVEAGLQAEPEGDELIALHRLHAVVVELAAAGVAAKAIAAARSAA
jgi:hypothetical protein